MTSPLTFIVPGHCKPWQRAGGSSRRYTPQGTRSYQQAVALCARAAGASPITGPVRLTITIYWADRRRRDIDNGGKTISDALNGIAYEDDYQITEIAIEKHLDCENPRAVITVGPAPVNRILK